MFVYFIPQILQIIYRLRNSPEPLYDASELKSWTGTILKKAEKNVDLASETDAVSFFFFNF